MVDAGPRRAALGLLIALMVLLFVTQGGRVDHRMLLVEWAALALQLAGLAALRGAAQRINNAPGNQRHAVFFGLGSEARKLNLRLQRSPILGIKVVGYYNDVPAVPATGETLPPYLGRANPGERLQDCVHRDWPARKGDAVTGDIVSRLYDSTAAIYLVPDLRFFEDLPANSTDLAGVPLLALHDVSILGLSRVVKRVIDVAGASLLLWLVWPAMIAIAIRLDSPGPVLFRQLRHGERGDPILVHKFRSMRVALHDEDEAGEQGLR
jgi:putative colanic acid biosysnthesis UDP-glucose lipid carrier transferase